MIIDIKKISFYIFWFVIVGYIVVRLFIRGNMMTIATYMLIFSGLFFCLNLLYFTIKERMHFRLLLASIFMFIIVFFNTIITSETIDTNAILLNIIPFVSFFYCMACVGHYKISFSTVTLIRILAFVMLVLLFFASFSEDSKDEVHGYLAFHFYNPNSAGLFLLCLQLIFVSTHEYKKNARNVILLIIVSVVNFYLIWQTNCRTCLFLEIFSIVMMLLPGKAKLYRFLLIASLIFSFIYVFLDLLAYNSESIKNITIMNKSLFSGREEVFDEFISSIDGVPGALFGSIGEFSFISAHNGPLSILLSIGLVGMIPYYYVMYQPAFALLKSGTIQNKGVFISLIAITIVSCTEGVIAVGNKENWIFAITILMLLQSDENIRNTINDRNFMKIKLG